jgi:hypothetical protein
MVLEYNKVDINPLRDQKFCDIENTTYKDESFDLIENNQDRLKRLTEIVKDLCQQDLKQFLDACQETCKYNQQ